MEGESFTPSLSNIIEQESLHWIFVGGKGGVGKTTTASSLALQLAKHRSSVLIISTDPAHNLSDSFDQKFGREPTLVNGVENLFGMELDPEKFTEGVNLSEMIGIDVNNLDFLPKGIGGLKEVMKSIPGIDEAMGFAQVMKLVNNMDFSVIIFDTAPTGHTLRFLNFPDVLDQALTKIMEFKESMGGFTNVLNNVTQTLGANIDQETVKNVPHKVMDSLGSLKEAIQNVSAQFKDPEKTTFIAVCIPEFLSLYETERLVTELANFDIDIRNIVLNQIIILESKEDGSCCKLCTARRKMQNKYISQIKELYDDFHIIISPLQDDEVRGVEKLSGYAHNLFNPLKE